LIDVRLFGNLHTVTQAVTSPGAVIHLSSDGAETVGQVLDRLGVDAAEVSHLFLNGRLLPRGVYPISLGYPLTTQRPLSQQDWLDTPVHSGDRLGIFPLKMGLVVV
jgi:hypothetical protein